jgi:hypothetical protein
MGIIEDSAEPLFGRPSEQQLLTVAAEAIVVVNDVQVAG